MKRRLFPALLTFLAPVAFAAAPVSLFDGRSLEGWEGDAKWWRVEDGALTGGSRTEKVPRNFFLATTRSFHNFDLRLKLKLTGDPKTGMINSGVQIRSLRVPNNTEMSGFQVDAGEGWWGKMYDESRRNKVIAQAADLAAASAALKKDDWNEMRIRAEGPRIQSWINGVAALDYTEADPQIAQDGQIAVQIHSGGMAVVQVKDVTIEELPPTPDAPTWEKVGRPGAKKAAAADLKQRGARDISYNAVQTTARTPEEERATFKVPEGFEVELVAAEDPAIGIGKFVPIAFDLRGALWTTTALEYPVDGNENPAAADALYASQAKDKVLVYDRDPSQPTGYSPKPRVFADGLAIPLGVLPYKNGCFVQHGHDIVFLGTLDEQARRAGSGLKMSEKDAASWRLFLLMESAQRNGSRGQANARQTVLTGFGVQDSHLFPHQFLRAPGGWIWMAQGLFNKSAVKRPGAKDAVEFDMCRMAKFRPDGTGFEPTSVGPNNIWGLVLNGEGEAFIQEANDYGYAVMPFHEGAYYPSGSERLAKTYQPEFPSIMPDVRMGGTGLSGLALTDKSGPFPEPWRDVMLMANPITSRIQAVKLHRDGPRWRAEKLADFLTSDDPWFRPIAIAIGPDGCLYIVDWYNKIISHNEVPRNHPDRDKTRGRIWRVKANMAKPFDVPDFTKLSTDELIAKLGGPSLTQSHLAWQALADGHGGESDSYAKLEKIVRDAKEPTARRLQALWAAQRDVDASWWAVNYPELTRAADPALRRAAFRADRDAQSYAPLESTLDLQPFIDDPAPEVRAEVIRAFGDRLNHDEITEPSRLAAIRCLLSMAKAPLAGPVAPSTRGGKPIKVREAYDREFERYLVRMFLERHPDVVAKFLDSDTAKPLPVEARLLATLALEPKASAARVAKLLPQLQRAPGQEEVLRLAQFPDEPGVGPALQATLANPATRTATLEALLAVRTKLDAAKLTPFLADTASALLASQDPASLDLGVKLAAGFKLANVESVLIAVLERVARAPSPAISGASPETSRETDAARAPSNGSRQAREPAGGAPALPISLTAIRALADIGSARTDLFAKLAETSPDAAMRDEALAALAASKAADAPQRVLGLYPKLVPAQRRLALDKLAATKPGAAAVVAALTAGTVAKSDLDSAMLDRLQAVLGDNDPALAQLVDSLGALFRPVLLLDGTEGAWAQTNVTLDGPCTVEAWVRLDPEGRKIGNSDGILGAPGQLDLNFYAEKPRVYAFPPLGDVAVAKKPTTPGVWTHVAFTRDAVGIWKIYFDGELDATATKPAPGKIENARIGWTAAPGGTRGALSELRVWNRARTAEEIRAASDRSLPRDTEGLVFTTASGHWGQPQAGAKVIKTSDFPPMLTPDEAAALDAKYAKFRALAEKPGDIARGKASAALCTACHLIGTIGSNIGPNLSGVGAMGTEAILRNLLQPNAAMENGYRIFRVEMKNGDVVDALFVSEDKDAFVIRMPGSDDRRIAKKDIATTRFLRRSLMPEGLLDTMTSEQVSDLFAFLKTLK